MREVNGSDFWDCDTEGCSDCQFIDSVWCIYICIYIYIYTHTHTHTHTHASDAVNKLTVWTAFCIAVSEVSNYKVCLLWNCVQGAKMFADINELQNAGLTISSTSIIFSTVCCPWHRSRNLLCCKRNTSDQLAEQTVDEHSKYQKRPNIRLSHIMAAPHPPPI